MQQQFEGGIYTLDLTRPVHMENTTEKYKDWLALLNTDRDSLLLTACILNCAQIHRATMYPCVLNLTREVSCTYPFSQWWWKKTEQICQTINNLVLMVKLSLVEFVNHNST